MRKAPILTSLRARRGRAGECGITLVETAISLGALAVGMVAAASCLGASLQLDRANAETVRAFAVARGTMDRVRAETEARMYRSFDADPSNDPDGAGTAPGNLIEVPELGTTGGSAAGTCTVFLPYDNAGHLRENLDIPEIGLPRDLNADGTVDGADHAADALVLPFAVRVRWTGSTGQRDIVLRSALCR